MKRLTNLNNHIKIHNWKLWLTLSIIFSFFHFFNFLNLLNYENSWYNEFKGDSPQYINSVEHLISDGEFIFEDVLERDFYSAGADLTTVKYAFRTPGFLFTYYPLRLILSKDHALLAFLLLQVLCFSMAIYLFSLILYRLFNSHRLSVIFLICALLFPNLYFYNNYLYSESLGFSFLILSTYFYLKYFDRELIYLIVVSGFFFLLAIYMRPFLIIPFCVFSAYLWSRNLIIHSLKKAVLTASIYVAPFLLVHSIWVVRNYIKTDHFIPIAATVDYINQSHPAFKQIRILCKSDGQPIEYWEEESPLYWLRDDSNTLSSKSYFSNHITSDPENIQKLNLAKKMYHESRESEYSPEETLILENKAGVLVQKVIASYRSRSPARYYITSRFSSFSRLIANQKQYRLYTSYNPILGIPLSFISSFMYYLTYYFGLFSILVLLIIYRRNLQLLLLYSIPVFVMSLFVFLASSEARELYLCGPFLLSASVIVFVTQMSNTRKIDFPIKFIALIILLVLAYKDLGAYLNL